MMIDDADTSPDWMKTSVSVMGSSCWAAVLPASTVSNKAALVNLIFVGENCGRVSFLLPKCILTWTKISYLLFTRICTESSNDDFDSPHSQQYNTLRSLLSYVMESSCRRACFVYLVDYEYCVAHVSYIEQIFKFIASQNEKRWILWGDPRILKNLWWQLQILTKIRGSFRENT